MKIKKVEFAEMKYDFIRRQIKLDESGVLAFEWILVLTVLIIGIVGGVATLRDSVTLKMIDAAQAVNAVDPSYEIPQYRSRIGNDGTSMDAVGIAHSPAYLVDESKYAEKENFSTVIQIKSTSIAEK